MASQQEMIKGKDKRVGEVVKVSSKDKLVNSLQKALSFSFEV